MVVVVKLLFAVHVGYSSLLPHISFRWWLPQVPFLSQPRVASPEWQELPSGGWDIKCHRSHTKVMEIMLFIFHTRLQLGSPSLTGVYRYGNHPPPQEG